MSEALNSFVQEALQALEVPFTLTAQGDLQVKLPEAACSEIGVSTPVLFTFDKDRFQTSDRSDIEFITPGSPILTWLIEGIRALGNTARASVEYPDERCRLFLDKLVKNYSVVNGQVVSSGISFSDKYCVVFTALVKVESIETRETLKHIALDHEGQPIPDYLLKEFEPALLEDTPKGGAENTAPVKLEDLERVARKEAERAALVQEEEVRKSIEAKKAKEVQQLTTYFTTMREELKGLLESVTAREEREKIQHQIDTVNDQLSRRLKEAEDRFSVKSSIRFVGTLLLKHKRLEGELLLKGSSVESKSPISIAVGNEAFPDLRCEVSGKFTNTLAFTDDGKLVDQKLVGRCAQSGKVFLVDKLAKCSVSGRFLSPDFVIRCPVSDKFVETSRLVKCAECAQLVSPLVITRGACNACLNPSPLPIRPDILHKLLSRSEELRSWNKWVGNETRDVWTFQPSSTFKVGRLVVTKASMKVVRYAKRNKLLGRFKEEELVLSP